MLKLKFFGILLLCVHVCIADHNAATGDRHSVYRPCDVKDTSCIRRYLAAHSLCSPRVFNSPPHDPTLMGFRYEVPFFNASHLDHYITTRNLENCAVSELRNRTSRVTVLAIDCADLILTAFRRTILHNTGDEDEFVHFKIDADYRLVTLTVNLPNPDLLDICTVNAHAYIHFVPQLRIESDDPKSQQFISTDPRGMIHQHLDIWASELFRYRAAPLFQNFIDTVLCNFECDRRWI